MKKLQNSLVLILFSLFITFLVNWKIPVKGLIPFPGDLLVGRFFPYNTQNWEGYPLGVPYKEFINADVIRQLYPWRDSAITLLKQGQIPWWNPYAFSGTPLLANLQSAPFYPLNVIYWFTDHPSAWIIQVLLQPVLAIIFMFIFTRNLGLSKPAAAMSALAFAFSGYMVIWWELNSVGQAALWLPLILLGIDRLIKKPDKSSLLIIFLGITSSFLAGHIQTSIYVICVLLAYFFWRLKKQNQKSVITTLFYFGVALFTSALVASLQIIPALRFMPHTVRGTQPDTQIYNHFIMPLKHLATFIAHDFFGNPAVGNFWGTDYGEFMAYFGVVALVFCLTAIFSVRTAEVNFFTLTALTGLLFALPTPLPYIVHFLQIPVLSTSVPARTLFVVQFSAAVLAGVGVNFWQQKNNYTILKTYLAKLGVLFIVLWLVASLGLLRSQGVNRANWKVSLRNLVIPTGIFVSTSAVLLLGDRLLKRRSSTLVHTASIVLIFLFSTLEYSYFVNKFQTFSEPRFFFPSSPIYAFLSSQSEKYPWRFFGDYTASVTSNSWIPYRIYSVEGYDSLYSRRYAELLAAAETGKIPRMLPRSDANLMKNQDDTRRRRLQDLLGVGFILDKNDNPQSDWEPDPHRFPPERYQLIWQEGKFKIYENTRALPRAFLTEGYKVLKNPQEIINLIFDPDFDLSKMVILEEPVPEIQISKKENMPSIHPYSNKESATDSISLQSRRTEDVTFIRYTSNLVELKVESSTTQLLLLSDAYYPDWKASVNGKNTKIYRADYAFRAIVVSPGVNRVVFNYEMSFK